LGALVRPLSRRRSNSRRTGREYEGRLTIAKLNTDEEQRVAGSLGIMAIPTMIFFKVA